MLTHAMWQVAKLDAEAEVSRLQVSRVEAENGVLEAKLGRSQEDALKVQRELESLLDDAESQLEQLQQEVDAQRKLNTSQYSKYCQEVKAMRESVANAERAVADANYNLEARTKQLGDGLNAEREANLTAAPEP